MKEKELKKLSRTELLELLLTQTQEAEQLRRDLYEARQQLRDRRIRLNRAGDLAAAVVEVNGVMEAAQAAAKQYLDNMAEMEKETELTCRRLIEDAREEADRIIQQARQGTDEVFLSELHELLDEGGPNETDSITKLRRGGAGAEAGTL